MDTGLRGKVVFVTGASGGIGRAMVRTFADEGASLVLQGYRQLDDLRDWVADSDFADRSLCVGADVSDPEALEGAFAEARERFGRVDVCLANAGVWPPADLPLHELPPARVREVVGVNLLGATWTARAFARSLAATGPSDDGHGASLVFTGSTAGRFGERGHADYALSKAGLLGLVRTLKNELPQLDPGARVNLVEPGWTVTAMARPALEDDAQVERATRTMALRQLARADDIARTALFLSSPLLARHLTGQVLTVAGGMEGRLLWSADDVDADSVRARTVGDPSKA